MGETEKKIEARITMVLVDTSAFVELNSDFIGLRSRLIPSFFAAIHEKRMALLTHPILEHEIEKHIEDSSIYKDFQKLVTQTEKCRDVLVLADCMNQDLLNKIKKFDVKAKTFQVYQDNYARAVRLGYPKPEMIFNQYFNTQPPFAATGKKKSEFPDAFIIEATKQYIENHPDDTLMVVSKDDDWKQAFCDVENVFFSDSISNAITIINSIESVLSEELIEQIFNAASEEIAQEILSVAQWECYDFPEYEFEDDFEVDHIEVLNVSDLFVPLRITRSSLLIKVDATLLVDGHGVVFDADNSVWDKEDGVYIFKEYADLSISQGEADIECEILLEFDFDEPASTVQVSNVKINAAFNIDVEGGEVDLSPIDEIDEIDVCGEMMDTLEDYYKH